MVTSSPRPATAHPELELCGAADGALREVAARLAERERDGRDAPDGDELRDELRRAGDPHVWPHAWVARVRLADGAKAAGELRAAVEATPLSGVRRCGIARLALDGSTEVLSAVWLDALSDLAPLPVSTQSARWLSFSATMLVPTNLGKLFVLPPSGVPFTVPTALLGREVRATVPVSEPGAFRLQLVARVDGGPRPVLEAVVFRDEAPPPRYEAEHAPGEDEISLTGDPATALVEMTARARARHSLPALRRSGALDRLAAEHAAAMASSGALAHDSGDGEPIARATAGGLGARLLGENVAHETSVVRAARALWSSASHRANILDPRFRSIGVGAVRGPGGSLWIAELFADYRDDGIDGVSANRDRSFDAPHHD